jgi:DNA polymerase III delta subunit
MDAWAEQWLSKNQMIIFLHGADSFRSNQKLREYRERFLKKYGSQAGLTVIDADDNPDFKLAKLNVSQGLFSTLRLVIIKNLTSHLNPEAQEQAIAFLRSNKNILDGKDVVIILWEGELSKKSSRLFVFLKKVAQIQEFKKLEGNDIYKWTIERLKEICPEQKISRDALEKLVAYTSGDSRLIQMELEKLASFKDQGEISEEDVDQVVVSLSANTIFETIEAASSGNKRRALELLHGQLENKKDPFYLLSMYVYQFRNMLKIGEVFWRGSISKNEISKLTNIHPFVVQKILPQLKNFSLSGLQRIYQNLQEIDEGIKTGKMEDARFELDLLLTKL